MLASLGVFVVAVAMLMSAMQVIAAKNLVHSVFWLAAMLIATAGLYIGLEAPFLASIQVLLYAGGVITMMLFGVMLTQRAPGNMVPNASEHSVGRATVAGLLGVTLLVAIWTTPELAAHAPVASASAKEIGAMFLGPYLVAFEVLSMLLLAGMIGAIVLARRGDA